MAGDPKSQKLIKHLMKAANKSGAIKPSPQALMKLKEGIEKVPFELLKKGMSGVVNSQALMKGIQKVAGQLGGLNQVGEFKNLLSKAASVSGSGGAGLTDTNAAAIASVVTAEELEAAVGTSMALGLSLMAGLDDKDQEEIDKEASNTA